MAAHEENQINGSGENQSSISENMAAKIISNKQRNGNNINIETYQLARESNKRRETGISVSASVTA